MTLRQLKAKYLREGIRFGYKKALNEAVISKKYAKKKFFQQIKDKGIDIVSFIDLFEEFFGNLGEHIPANLLNVNNWIFINDSEIDEYSDNWIDYDLEVDWTSNGSTRIVICEALEKKLKAKWMFTTDDNTECFLKKNILNNLKGLVSDHIFY